MRMVDAYSAKAIALVHNEVASNQIPYLGAGFFPTKKKAGLDLKWIKTTKGLPVTLAPSAFDTKSTIRSREGLQITATEMAFFKESMLVKEQDEQDVMRVQDSADPFAQEVLNRIYDDAETLVAGAEVVKERMIMQLLSSAHYDTSASKAIGPSISISADGATYAYNYDPDETYANGNFDYLTGTSSWTDTANSDPIKDVMDAQDAVEAKTGSRPSVLIVSKNTMNLLKQNAKIKSYVLSQNVTANIVMTDARVNEVFGNELGVSVVVYSKQFKDEDGVTQKFYPDKHATLVPNGQLGNLWMGITPEERTGMMNPSANVSVVNEGVAISVTISEDPVQTKTTVSEICLPSFERIDETYQIQFA